MLFAIDIDQTICGSNAYEIYANFHTNDLRLSIEPSVLTHLTSYRDFFLLPQVVAFRQANEKEWNASRHRAIATPSVIEAFSPIDGAAHGIDLLSCYGQIGYYTARTPVVRDATQRWLERYAFASSQKVICCTNIEQKILALSSHTPQDEPIILFDDRGHTHFLTILEEMKEQECVQNLMKRLTIVAFRASVSALPATDLCPLLALPCWNDLPVLLEQIQEGCPTPFCKGMLNTVSSFCARGVQRPC